MEHISQLLDKAMKMRSIPSDMALAGKMDVSRSIVSEWRKGKKVPSEEHVCELARMAKEDAGRWLLIAQAQRSHGAAHAEWVGLLRQFGIAAMLVVAVAVPTGAKAAEFAGNAYYVNGVWAARGNASAPRSSSGDLFPARMDTNALRAAFRGSIPKFIGPRLAGSVGPRRS